MKSTIVIYEHEHESGKASAKHIAYYLGAQTTCTRHIEPSIVDSYDNFVLCVSSWNGDSLPTEWDRAMATLGQYDLSGKLFTVYVDGTLPAVQVVCIDSLYALLRRCHARVVSMPVWQRTHDINEWICSMSPNL